VTAADAGEVAEAKRVAAEWAAELVEPGVVVGLGTGSTAVFARRRIAERLADGSLTDGRGIPTSEGAAATAAELGIPITTLEEHPVIDLMIDGADEVDPALNLIKGGGGALLREKIVAQASRREVIVVDASKRSPRLGTRHSLPVEVVEFGWRPEALHLESLAAKSSGERPRTPHRFAPITSSAPCSVWLSARAEVRSWPNGFSTIRRARSLSPVAPSIDTIGSKASGGTAR